jgi:hypothetical protein
VTASVAANHGKNIDEGTTTPVSISKSDRVAVADPREAQTLRPATTKEASDILIDCRNQF